MQNEPQRKLETLFHAASSRGPGLERKAYLDGACGNDAELRSRVEVLLKAHDASAGFLEEPASGGSREQAGSTIGNYKLLQEIGEGGMGVVYMAEQEQPVRRKVALKIIKLGMDTKQVMARFEAERQALALMDHEHIARVFDAGATESGRLYFVMELVRGEPINVYCDKHKLSTEARLSLFVDVCRAVQHAHQKGIIHRDLKPSNVLISSHDGRPVPKIIDFGVAKATNQKLTERTLFTEFHQVIGTPEYMSPEQAEMSGLDVDTRSDIYSLGVLLYNLLTGTTPADPTDLRTAAFAEMSRMIREDEPPAPSTRITRLGQDGERIARQRASDPRSLAREFSGDLDWIVMKALEKDRTRRYEHASAFAEDVERHLDHRPVEAGPPGTLYRLRKFARRHRAGVLLALVLILVAGLGLGGTLSGYWRARSEAQRSTLISDSLQDVLAMSDPSRAADREAVRGVLARVREMFGEGHATYAAILDTLSVRLHEAGDFAEAEALARQSVRVWEKVMGHGHPNVARALAQQATCQRAQGDDEGAFLALNEALSIYAAASETPGFGSLDARAEMADLLANRGDYSQAEARLRESLEILRASPSPARYRIFRTLERLAMLQMNQAGGDALETVRELYEEGRAFYPEDSPVHALTALGLGRQLFEHGQRDAALPFLRDSMRRFRALAEPRRIYMLAAADVLFQILRSRQDAASQAEADAALADMIELGRTIWSPDMLELNLRFYAGRMQDRGRPSAALGALMDSHQLQLDSGASWQERENVRDNLTRVAFDLCLDPGLEPAAYARALAAAERALGDEPDHPAMLVALAAAHYRLGEYAQAAETLALQEVPLRQVGGGLAKYMLPADQLFLIMSSARLGDRERAQGELQALQVELDGSRLQGKMGRLLGEAEATLGASGSALGGE